MFTGIIFAVSLSASTQELHDADLKLMQACFENGMARGRLTELEKWLESRGLRVDPKIPMMLAQPVPRGCDGKSR